VTAHDEDTATDTSDHMAADPGTDWEAAYAGDVPNTPVDSDVVALVKTLEPGTALDLGCGSGQNTIWLAERGWRVHGVDIAANAIGHAEQAATDAGIQATFEAADVTSWRTSERFDLVVSTYALPPRGHGRTHALTVARDAVAPGGVALIAEFEIALADAGWMTEDNLVSLDEITEMFPGFDLERAEVKVTAHSHGADHKELPIAIVVARHPGPLSSQL
jgi:cyclopropane fatty-acyl-phospholipid synthase-like methyltransferase